MNADVGGTLFAIILIYIVGGCIFGHFTSKLANHKGYRGGFWMGFFGQFFYLVYVAGLPISKERVLEEQKQLATLIAEAVIYEQEKE